MTKRLRNLADSSVVRIMVQTSPRPSCKARRSKGKGKAKQSKFSKRIATASVRLSMPVRMSVCLPGALHMASVMRSAYVVTFNGSHMRRELSISAHLKGCSLPDTSAPLPSHRPRRVFQAKAAQAQQRAPKIGLPHTLHTTREAARCLSASAWQPPGAEG